MRVLAERQLLRITEVFQHVTVGWWDPEGQQPDNTATHGGFLFRPGLENTKGDRLALIDDCREARHGVTLHGARHLAFHCAEVPCGDTFAFRNRSATGRSRP